MVWSPRDVAEQDHPAQHWWACYGTSRDSKDVELEKMEDESSDEEESVVSEHAALTGLFRRSLNEELVLPFESSTYDGVTVAILLFFDECYRVHQGELMALGQLLYMVCLHLAAIMGQSLLVYWTFFSGLKYDIDPYYQAVQWADVVEKALATHPPAPLSNMTAEGDQILAHCKADTTHSASHVIVLMIWGTRMVMEVADACWRSYRIFKMPSVETPGKLVDWAGHPARATRLNGPVRFLLVILLTVPQFCIAVGLAWTGAKLLATAVSMNGLVLKALTLQYIIGLDELIYSAFASLRFKRLADSLSLHLVLPTPSNHWRIWGSNTLKLLVCGVYLSVVLCAFRHLRHLRKACRLYLSAVPKDSTAHAHPHWLFGTFPTWLM